MNTGLENQATGTEWVLLRDVSEVMEVTGWGYEGPSIAFRGKLKLPSDRAFDHIRGKASAYGLLPFLQADGEEVFLRFAPSRRQVRSSRPHLHLLLFLATVISTLLVGVGAAGADGRDLLSHPLVLLRGLPFSITLMTILGCHEFGHYFMSRKHGVQASLPYFIPFPLSPFGTMGAVIVSRSPFPNRKTLFDVGIAGPLVSFVLSVAAIAIGLSELRLVDLPIGPGGLNFGDSLLTKFLFQLRFPHVQPQQAILIGPISFAGWVGLFVTAMNLFPIGQLDGGHLAYAVFGKKHSLIANVFIGILLVLGLRFWQGWLFWVVLILLLGVRHLPPMDDLTPVGPGRRLLAVLALLILILCFVPVPLEIF